jgi:hypothetical protein
MFFFPPGSHSGLSFVAGDGGHQRVQVIVTSLVVLSLAELY